MDSLRACKRFAKSARGIWQGAFLPALIQPPPPAHAKADAAAVGGSPGCTTPGVKLNKLRSSLDQTGVLQVWTTMLRCWKVSMPWTGGSPSAGAGPQLGGPAGRAAALRPPGGSGGPGGLCPTEAPALGHPLRTPSPAWGCPPRLPGPLSSCRAELPVRSWALQGHCSRGCAGCQFSCRLSPGCCFALGQGGGERRLRGSPLAGGQAGSLLWAAPYLWDSLR